MIESSKKPRCGVVVMAGGTGGHIFPALAVAEHLRSRGWPVCWLGTRQGLEARLVPAREFPIEWIEVRGLRGSGLKRWLGAPMTLARAVWQARAALRRQRPGVVLGMGGFTAGPGGLAAWLMGIPLVIHEQNRLPGLTNRVLSWIATRVFEAFPGSFPPFCQARRCGNPVREDILALAKPSQRFEKREGPLRLLVLGGSQGASALNRLVPEGLAGFAAIHPLAIWHQTGPADLNATQEHYQRLGLMAEVTGFIEEMAAAYAWADLVIARSGALTLAELAAAGVGSILVPFPFAVDDHQTHNAAFFADMGAAWLLPQGELTAGALTRLLVERVPNRQALLKPAEAARALAHPDATEILASACQEVARS
ncbi:MAG: undecaprenyldiphospho-muramoylpentapeptide beta-N-acetylglucosaminyltransferase [Pseudomonadota bacterium]